MEQWKEYRLGDLCTISSSKRIFAKEYVNEGIPFYRGKEIIQLHKGEEISDHLYISKVRYSEIRNKYGVPKVGDILLTSVGTLGIPYIIKHSDFYFKDGNLTWFYNFKNIRNTYLYYWFCSKYGKSQIDKIAIGSTQKALTINSLSEILIQIPPFKVQDKIVEILKSLDSKIDLNRKINSNLEEQAKALFKSWFIDFEPFKDGKFVDSELGKIPEGWEVVTIGDVTENIKDKVGDRDNIKVLSPITSGQLVLSEDYFSKQVFSNSIAKYIVVKHNDFAYNPARINIGSIGMNEFNFDGCVSPVYVVFRCQKGYEYFFNLYRRTTFFAEEVKKRAIGGVRQTLSYKDLSLIQLVYPPQKVVDNFNSIIISLLHTIHSNDVSNKKLEAIRDLLLPRLMSGEINVRL